MAGRWVSAACWHNCGGRCANRVLVEDGVVVRHGTDASHPDSPDYPQQRACVRGWAQEQQCFGEDRLLHPLVRAHWRPGGGDASAGRLRGRDEWRRVGWDEAVELACREIGRIREEYGDAAFACKHPSPALDAICTCVRGWDTSSHGSFGFDCDDVGLPSRGLGCANDRLDLPNADFIVLYASNPAWSAPGTPVCDFLRARDAGTRFFCVDPMYNATAQTLGARWLPVRPGTDMALLLAVAFEMLRLDEREGGVVDWEFLRRCAVGFDAEHMPADARLDENLFDYVRGAYDGVPKSPAWAAPRCGVAPARITELARAMGRGNKTMLLYNYGMARTNGSEMLPQMLFALAAMGGHMGKPGHACGSVYHADCGNAGPRLVSAPPPASRPRRVRRGEPVNVRQPQLYELILNGGGRTSDVASGYYRFHEPRPVEVGPIKAIFHMYDAALDTSMAQKLGIEAHRSVDFVLSCATFMTTNARYSDIVLPVSTEWERVGGVLEGNREYVQCYTRVCEPRGEAKSDQEIDELLLAGMGVDPREVYPAGEEQRFYDQVAACRVRGADGREGPLVTITDEDRARLARAGVDVAVQQGAVGLDAFLENGGYQVPRAAGDGAGHIGFAQFAADPEAHPLPSASGRIEIYCQRRYDLLTSIGFPGAQGYKPYPTYVAPAVGFEATFEGGEVGAGPSDYPFLLFNPHYLRRSHTVFDNCSWLAEAWRAPVMLNASDARTLGVEEGDEVVVSTPHGSCRREATLLEVLRPGVVGLPHGAWVDAREDGVDRAGADNYLLGPEPFGCGLSGYNNQVCNVRRACERPASRRGDGGEGEPEGEGRAERARRAEGRAVRAGRPEAAGAPASPAPAASVDGERLGFLFDMTRCTGCKACVLACRDRNRGIGAVSFRDVTTWSTGEFPDVAAYSLSESCRRCARPACAAACRARALRVDAQGTVRVERAACTGCGACARACPHGAVKMLPDGRAGVCDACAPLREAGEQPACVAACPSRALSFGPLAQLRERAGGTGAPLATSLPVAPDGGTLPTSLIKPAACALAPEPREVRW